MIGFAFEAAWPAGVGAGSARLVPSRFPPSAASNAVTPPSLRALEGRVPAMASKSFAAGSATYGWPGTLTHPELLERRLLFVDKF